MTRKKSLQTEIEELRSDKCVICTGIYPQQWLWAKQNGENGMDSEVLVVVLCNKHSTAFHELIGKLIVEERR